MARALDPGEVTRNDTSFSWAPYLDGSEWEFGPEDFGDDLEKFRNRVFSAASRNGKRALTRKATRADGTEVLHVQFV